MYFSGHERERGAGSHNKGYGVGSVRLSHLLLNLEGLDAASAGEDDLVGVPRHGNAILAR